MDPGWDGDPLNAFGRGLEFAAPLVTAEKVPERVNKLKALGNAIVPQVAYEILAAIDAAEREGTA